MPRFNSKGGKWYPQNERVALKNNSKTETVKNPSTDAKLKGEEIKPGQDYIYSGPDRAALFELWKAKVDHFGSDFRRSPDFLQAVRNMGYTSYKQYLKDIGFNEEKLEKEFAEKSTIVSSHELPAKVDAIEQLAGGKDTSGGGQDKQGAFGLPPELK